MKIFTQYRSARVFNLVMALFLVFSTACGSDDDKNESAEESTMTHGDHNHDHQDHEMNGDPAIPVAAKNGSFHTKIEWHAEPKAGEPANSAMVHFFDADGEPLGAQLTGFHPYMPAHGHGASEDAIAFNATDESQSVWHVEGIAFSMAGQSGSWVIHLHASVDGQTDEATVPVYHEVK